MKSKKRTHFIKEVGSFLETNSSDSREGLPVLAHQPAPVPPPPPPPPQDSALEDNFAIG